PMWDNDGPADADFAVTKSGFDILPLTGALGSEFVAEFGRYPDTASSANHATWLVGIRVGAYYDFGEPYGPVEPGTWNALGTYVYLITWVSGTTEEDEVFIETAIPGFGEGVWIVPGVQGTPPGIIPEWWKMEVEEDNATQQTRARIYLKSTTPGDEEGWTPWQDHNPAVTYAGTEGQVSGFMGANIQMDNWYITGEGGVPAGNPGDANNDSVVSADDYGSVQLNFGATGAVNIPGDANLDGVVSADDYGSVQLHFGTVYGAGGASVPEPGTIGLLAMGMVAILRKRK
ncbi:MAG TPA: PEP-CTERM sorting domain-containing protein, partial [Phycisphaerae bacterium]|nr:PEP-CTERM sorting domain-containing protein [Phycisphaerae bacterium]